MTATFTRRPIELSVSPDQLAFLDQSVGTQSVSQTVIVKNNSNLKTAVATIGLDGGGSSHFRVESDCGELLAGASCEVEVSFNPSTTGQKSAVIQIQSESGGAPLEVPVSGAGGGY